MTGHEHQQAISSDTIPGRQKPRGFFATIWALIKFCFFVILALASIGGLLHKIESTKGDYSASQIPVAGKPSPEPFQAAQPAQATAAATVQQPAAVDVQTFCAHRRFAFGVYQDDPTAAHGRKLSDEEQTVLGNGNFSISEFRVVNGMCYALTTIDGTAGGNSYRSQHWLLLTAY